MQQTRQNPKLKTLIVAATCEEIAHTFEHFNLQKANFVEHVNFDILISGVGMAATAFALGRKLNDSYGLVLNVGIAGSFDKTLALGTLVNITTDTLSEFGAEDGEAFIRIDELGFGKSTYTSNFSSEINLINALPSVNSITVNTVHGNAKTIHRTLERVRVQTESMEGAAVLFACEQLNIPALQIRSISNYIEQRNRDNWEISLALKNLNEWLIKYLTL